MGGEIGGGPLLPWLAVPHAASLLLPGCWLLTARKAPQDALCHFRIAASPMGMAPTLFRPDPPLAAPVCRHFAPCTHTHTYLACLPTHLPADYGDPNLQQLILLLPKDEVMRKITQVR